MARLSVIVASYLQPYTGAATYRQEKFIRAMDSLVNQTFQDFEVIVVADGCKTTAELFAVYYQRRHNFRLVELPKQKLWSGNVRNAGIAAATGEYITYLDTDDKLGKNHLQIIDEQVSGFDWVWYDDYIMGTDYLPRYNKCQLTFGKCGTSNITHRRDLPVKWLDSTYAHDWKFIQVLMQHKNFVKIQAPEYHICHLPNRLDV